MTLLCERQQNAGLSMNCFSLLLTQPRFFLLLATFFLCISCFSFAVLTHSHHNVIAQNSGYRVRLVLGARKRDVFVDYMLYGVPEHLRIVSMLREITFSCFEEGE